MLVVQSSSNCFKLPGNARKTNCIRCLELWFEAFWGNLSVESFGICAVVIDHVILSDPIQLPHLGVTQLLVSPGSPPICRDIGGTLIDALCSTPLASPCSEMVESGHEWCAMPVCLNKPASCCPFVCVP